MENRRGITETIQELLCCPVCHSSLTWDDRQFCCDNPQCGARFPVLDGIPVLLNELTSVFSTAEIVARHKESARSPGAPAKGKKRISGPQISANVRAKKNYARLAGLLLRQSSSPRVLIAGGSVLGEGMECLANSPGIELIETDVVFGPRTQYICDAHDIPFRDHSFDAVIAQAVLEHVVDPNRCVEEIHRVLKSDGLVYAETPFIQQVHGGCYDFTRFTHLGHRRLFRHFEEIDSGATCGPGMALAWSYQYFLMSFTNSSRLKKWIRAFAALTSFYLKYFDYWLIDKPGALDGASGCYFLGRKSDRVLTDRELTTLYKGASWPRRPSDNHP